MPFRPTHAFSIVARDPATGSLGAAAQSRGFAVGNDVPWVRAGIGAVATQSFIHPAWGPGALDRLAAGKTPDEALAELVAADDGEALRQAGVVSATGTSAAHTGERCIAQASHHHGQDFSVQANMMARSSVVPAMVSAWEKSVGSAFPERLTEVLRAGQAAAGADIRGQQSAALLVAPPKATTNPRERYEVRLRVDDHLEPTEELARLLGVHRGHEHLAEAEVALDRGDHPIALAHYATASELIPDSIEIKYWHGLLLIQAGDTLRGTAALRMVFSREESWIAVTRRLGDAKIIDQETAARVLTIVTP